MKYHKPKIIMSFDLKAAILPTSLIGKIFVISGKPFVQWIGGDTFVPYKLEEDE